MKSLFKSCLVTFHLGTCVWIAVYWPDHSLVTTYLSIDTAVTFFLNNQLPWRTHRHCSACVVVFGCLTIPQGSWLIRNCTHDKAAYDHSHCWTHYWNAGNSLTIVQTQKNWKINCFLKYNTVISDPFTRNPKFQITVRASWLIASVSLGVLNPTPFKENNTRFLEYYTWKDIRIHIGRVEFVGFLFGTFFRLLIFLQTPYLIITESWHMKLIPNREQVNNPPTDKHMKLWAIS